MKLKETLNKIRKFETAKGFVGSFNNDGIFCPQVNGLANLCLKELGFANEAKKNTLNFLKSSSFDKKEGLFHREVNTSGEIIAPYFNVGKNAIFALNLASNGFMKEAKRILEKLKISPAYLKNKGLYLREYKEETGEVNSLLLTQTNLWIALAYLAIEKNEEAKETIRALEEERYEQDCGLFYSQDCRDQKSEERFFIDDQALAIILYYLLGKTRKAKNLMKAVLNSPFYDYKEGLFNSSFSDSDTDTTKSTYKNSIMAQALAQARLFSKLIKLQKGLIKKLYDSEEKLFNQTTKDKTKVPDNSLLALVALQLT